MFFSPLEQFSILEQFSFFIRFNLLDITIMLDASISLFLIENLHNLLVFFVVTFLFIKFMSRNFISTVFIISLLQKFLYTIFSQQIKKWRIRRRYFILIATIFLFILINNIFGIIPYSFVSTAQLGQNFFLSSCLIIFLTQLGFYYLWDNFIYIFIPAAPLFMMPFLFIIELISYVARAFSLAIRLFANLMSGHTLLFILCAFNTMILNLNFFGFLIASVVILLIFGLELVIAFMQAYVFTVLISVYLKDSTVKSSH